MLLQRLSQQPLGFGQLHRVMPGVAARVLRQQLRELEADGLVSKRQLLPARLGVRYEVTSYGRTIEPVLETLWRWGSKHLERPGASRGTMVAPPRFAGVPTK